MHFFALVPRNMGESGVLFYAMSDSRETEVPKGPRPEVRGAQTLHPWDPPELLPKFSTQRRFINWWWGKIPLDGKKAESKQAAGVFAEVFLWRKVEVG